MAPRWRQSSARAPEPPTLAAAAGPPAAAVTMALTSPPLPPFWPRRCGGIYGPRRSVLDAVSGGRPDSASQRARSRPRYTARCHVLDVCRVLQASMGRPDPGAVYNIVDDDPAGREEAMDFATALLRRQAAGRPAAAPAVEPGSLAYSSVEWDAASNVGGGSSSSSSSSGSGGQGGSSIGAALPATPLGGLVAAATARRANTPAQLQAVAERLEEEKRVQASNHGCWLR